jgi:hypothetical protein
LFIPLLGVVKIFGPGFVTNVGPVGFWREDVLVSGDVEWRLLEWVEGPAADRPDVFREMRERHPEIAGVSDAWLCVDVVCGRDGVTRKRFMVRASPPPACERSKPRPVR